MGPIVDFALTRLGLACMISHKQHMFVVYLACVKLDH